MSTVRKKVGAWGEDQAAAFLARQGFTVVERNFFATTGEIDIIARRDEDWYFVEVKTRQSGDMATYSSITPAKKHKLEKTVKSYCFKRGIAEGSFILAGLLVEFNRATRHVTFRFAVFY